MTTVNLTIKPEDVEYMEQDQQQLEWNASVYIVLNEQQAMDLLKEIVVQLHANSFEKETA